MYRNIIKVTFIAKTESQHIISLCKFSEEKYM